MTQFGRVIDLDRCIGCHACAAVCSVENQCSPDTPWNVVLQKEIGEFPHVRESFTPMGCMHCENAPCEQVCKYIGVNAISTNEYGVVLVDYEQCISCGYCASVCPYDVPQFRHKNLSLYQDNDATPYETIPADQRHDLHNKKNGSAQKCTFCWHKLEKAINDKATDKIGTDPQYTPACDVVCPVDARAFGDISDPKSKVSKWLGEKQAGQMKKEFGTSPKVFYVSKGGDY